MKRGNIQRKQLNAIVVLILASFILSGCIRDKPPIQPTATQQTVGFQPTPFVTSSIPVITQPPQNTPQPQPTEGEQLTDEQAQIIRNAADTYFTSVGGFTLPVAEGTFSAWYSRRIDPDIIVGFTFNNPNGLPCVGVVAYRGDQGVILVFTGGYHCATDPNIQGVAGQWLLALNSINSGNPVAIMAIGGYVTAPNVSSVTVEYSTTPSTPEVLNDGKFFRLNPDYLNFATIVNVLDQSGGTVGVLAVPLNPQN